MRSRRDVPCSALLLSLLIIVAGIVASTVTAAAATNADRASSLSLRAQSDPTQWNIGPNVIRCQDVSCDGLDPRSTAGSRTSCVTGSVVLNSWLIWNEPGQRVWMEARFSPECQSQWTEFAATLWPRLPSGPINCGGDPCVWNPRAERRGQPGYPDRIVDKGGWRAGSSRQYSKMLGARSARICHYGSIDENDARPPKIIPAGTFCA